LSGKVEYKYANNPPASFVAPEETITDNPYWTTYCCDLDLKKGVKLLEEKSSNFGDCKCPKFIYDDSEKIMDFAYGSDTLIYKDYEGWKAFFHTGKEFGCCHWEGI